jgi:hypothetical protein
LPFFLLPLPKSFQKFNLPHFILLLNHLFLLFFFFPFKPPIFFPFNIPKFFWACSLMSSLYFPTTSLFF